MVSEGEDEEIHRRAEESSSIHPWRSTILFAMDLASGRESGYKRKI